MPQNLISVLMPVRQWRTTTAEAVRSMLNQTHQNIELILIGQNPLAPLAAQLMRAQINDPRIRLAKRRANGIVGALNTGLAMACGTYIARMDDDDIAYPDRFETQMRYLQAHPDVQLCAGCIRFVDALGQTGGIKAGNLRYAQWLNGKCDPTSIALACYTENPMPHPTLIGQRSVWQQLGGYRDVPGPEDHDLILRAMLANIGMGKPSQILLDWREHPDRLTYKDPRYSRRAFIAQAAWALNQLGKGQSSGSSGTVWIAGTGTHARHWHDELTALGVTVLGFVDMHRPGPDRRKRSLPVITYKQLCTQRGDALVISAVTQTAGRSAVEAFFRAQQWREGIDFIVGG